MNKKILIIFGILLAITISYANVSLSPRAYVIPVSGNIEPGIAAFIERAINTSNNSDDIYIIELDTFGGRVDSALQIVDSLLKLKKERTIAYVKTKAISAGALIALACGRLVMQHNTTIGDCAPISLSSEGPQMLGEKFQSPLRAKFRTLAKRNDYPVTLAEAMVTEGIEVYRVELEGKTVYIDKHEYDDLSDEQKDKLSKKTVVAEGELLTMDDVEAIELGFSKASVSNISEMFESLKMNNYEILEIEENWSEKFVRYVSTIAPILLMIGLACIYMEMQAPGLGIPGIIGVVCLSLVFFSQYLVGLANYTEILLLIGGIFFLFAEIFILPGFGISGLVGIFLIATGMILSMQDFVIPNPELPWEKDLLINNIIQVLGYSTIAFALSLFFIRYIIPNLSGMLNDPYLSTNLKNSHAYSKEMRKVKLGDTGLTLSTLRPSGKIALGDEIIDVISEGEFIDQDSYVTVSEIKANRIIVRAS